MSELRDDGEEAAARLFLSYHKRNLGLAALVANAIRADVLKTWPNGPKVTLWYDESLEGGDRWDEKIQRELELADIILFLITPACLEARYMWDDEFPVALDRFRKGEGRVRLIPLLYAQAPARILTDRFTRGINHLPGKPHDQLADQWLPEVCTGVRKAIEGVLGQRPPPMSRLVPAIARAYADLAEAISEFGGITDGGFFGPVPAADLSKTLEALEAALGLPGRERLRAISVWEPKLRAAHVKLRHALPQQAERLRQLREHIDEIVTFATEEDTASPVAHSPTPVNRDTLDPKAVQGVRDELLATQDALEELGNAVPASNELEQEVREHTVDVGQRHVALAGALLDELEIDTTALRSEIEGVDSAVQNYSDVLTGLGVSASPAGTSSASRLLAHTANALHWTAKAAHGSTRLPAAPGGSADRDGLQELPGTQEDAAQLLALSTSDGAPPSVLKSNLPPIDLLDVPPQRRSDVDEAGLLQISDHLGALLNEFGIQGRITEIRPGPVVTLFELEPAVGVRSSKVIALAEDIARGMSVASARIAVIPGRNRIAIELPNADRQIVYLRDLISWSKVAGSGVTLPLVLGESIDGQPEIGDLSKMPHLLIAGITGSGKSVGMNAMLLSLLYKLPPEKCRFIMIDPKMLELSIYEGIPHLLAPVVTDPHKAVQALRWVVREMERRYEIMSLAGARNLAAFNQKAAEAAANGEKLSRQKQVGWNRETGEAIWESETIQPEPMPHIVVVISELAHLMRVASKEVENAAQQIAQMARPAGIHFVVATQHTTSDVITGTIKANFPTRISYMVTTKIDSRTILGEQGAEQLLGMGDLLWMQSGGKISRVHGPFVKDEEVERVVNWLKDQGTPEHVEGITDPLEEESSVADNAFGTSSGDPQEDMYRQAVAAVVRDKRPTTSYVQRVLRIGFMRATLLMERMEREGLVSAPDSQGKRSILAFDAPAKEEPSAEDRKPGQLIYLSEYLSEDRNPKKDDE